MIRFLSNTRAKIAKTQCNDSPCLQSHEIIQAEVLCTRLTQISYFSEEYKCLLNKKVLSTKSNLLKLQPFIDEKSKCLRLGGRLKHSNISEFEKHPYILPENSHFSKLIVKAYHLRGLHSGTQLTISLMREKYWVIHARQMVKRTISNCHTCVRHRGQRMNQLMGNLPSPRINSSEVFLHVGVDYAGPIQIRSTPGRGFKSTKGYIAVFVCMCTKAVHLEVVSGLDTRSFINAFIRFTSRRGNCAHVYSDCGTNFQGADVEIRRMFQKFSSENKTIVDNLHSRGIQWHFNPPAAPHFGGLWEAAVKSMKHHLRRVIGDHTLTFEELSTLVSGVEACLNSRPLVPLSDDPTDLNSLTPAHFLIGRPILSLPEETSLRRNPSLLK